MNQKILKQVNKLFKGDGIHDTLLNDIKIYTTSKYDPLSPFIYDVCLILVLQGKKIGHLSHNTLVYDSKNYLVVPTTLPLECETYASKEEPFISLIISIDKKMMYEIIDCVSKKELKQSKSIAESKFKLYYTQLLNKDSLLQEIENGGYKNSKDDKEIFANKISNLLADKYKGILDEEASKFEENIRKISEKIQISTQIPTSFFDFKAATLGLVASGVTAGAFAVVAAGITSNLGLYILVAQVGGLLTSAGIISSPIIATTAVSALGGPVTWVIGIAALVGGAIYGLFHRNAWKGKLAQSLIEGYENQDALGQYLDGIETFIKDTEKGVDDIKKGLDIAAKEDVKLSKLRSEANPQDFDNEIKQLKGFESSFKEVTSNYH